MTLRLKFAFFMIKGPPVSNWIRTPMQNLPGILAPEDQNLGNKERKGVKVKYNLKSMVE